MAAATLLVRADALLFYSLCTDYGRRTPARFFPFLLYNRIPRYSILVRADALLFYSLMYRLGQAHSYPLFPISSL